MFKVDNIILLSKTMRTYAQSGQIISLCCGEFHESLCSKWTNHTIVLWKVVFISRSIRVIVIVGPKKKKRPTTLGCLACSLSLQRCPQPPVKILGGVVQQYCRSHLTSLIF